MRKLDCLGLIVIGFYIPALTPRLNRSEASLQLSEKRTPGEHGTLLRIIFYFKFI
jgi:hypothetical protein